MSKGKVTIQKVTPVYFVEFLIEGPSANGSGSSNIEILPEGATHAQMAEFIATSYGYDEYELVDQTGV
jgi:hypothetical protein